MQRMNGWGSSEMSSLMERNPFKSFKRCVAEKAFLDDSDFNNECMAHGKKYEDVVTAYIERKYKSTVHKTTCVFSDIPDWLVEMHGKHNIMFDSSDGQMILNGEPIVLEIKCPFRRRIGHRVPTYYMDQIQNHLFNTGFSKCMFVDCSIGQTAEFMDTYEDRSGLVGVSPTKGTIMPKTWPFDCPDWEEKARAEIVKQAPDAKIEWWCIHDISILMEEPNPRWIIEVYPRLVNFWEIVLKYRQLLVDTVIEVAGITKTGNELQEVKGLIALLLSVRPCNDPDLAAYLDLELSTVKRLRDCMNGPIYSARDVVKRDFNDEMRKFVQIEGD